MPKLPAATYIRSYVSEGLSANEGYRRFQQARDAATEETGDTYTGVRRSTFLQMYSEVRASRARVPEAIAAPLDAPGGGLTPLQRQVTRPGGYGGWAKIFYRPVGESELMTGYYFTRSRSLLTPQQVIDAAMEDFAASMADEHGSVYQHVLEGVVFTGIEQLVAVER